MKIRFSAQKNAHFSGFVGLFISFYESKKPFSALFRFFSSCEESFFFFIYAEGQFLVLLSAQKVNL